MIEVFKTNISEQHIADGIVIDLYQRLPLLSISFDLDDCDKILRVESEDIIIAKVHQIVRSQGYLCEVLEE